jgi:hypothetical protein
MLSFMMLNVVALNVILQNVVAPSSDRLGARLVLKYDKNSLSDKTSSSIRVDMLTRLRQDCPFSVYYESLMFYRASLAPRHSA